MRWVLASIAAGAFLVLTYPVLASGSSSGPGPCTSLVGFRTLGDGESCDTWGVAFYLPAAVLLFAVVSWAGKRLGRRAKVAR